MAGRHSPQFVFGYRDASNSNLRTGLLRILRRAAIKPWERLFHNLRASRQTELCDDFPSHVVADWLGNTPGVADKHYLLVTEQHFQKASSKPQTAAQGGAIGGARQSKKGGATVVPNVNAPNRTATQTPLMIRTFCKAKLSSATRCKVQKYTPLDSNQ